MLVPETILTISARIPCGSEFRAETAPLKPTGAFVRTPIFTPRYSVLLGLKYIAHAHYILFHVFICRGREGAIEYLLESLLPRL